MIVTSLGPYWIINANSVALFEIRLVEAKRIKLHNAAYFLTAIIFIYYLGPLETTFHSWAADLGLEPEFSLLSYELITVVF